MSLLEPFLELNRISPKQRTEEWLIQRRDAINASEIGGVNGVGHYTTARKVIRGKVLLSADEVHEKLTGPALSWGSKFEPVAKMLAERICKHPIEECASYQHPQYPFIRGSPDGMFEHDGKFYTCEFKCPYNRIPTAAGPSLEYHQQIQTVLQIARRVGCANPSFVLEGCRFLDLGIRTCSLEQLEWPFAANYRYKPAHDFLRFKDAVGKIPHILMFAVTSVAGRQPGNDLIDFGAINESELTCNPDLDLTYVCSWNYVKNGDGLYNEEYPKMVAAAQKKMEAAGAASASVVGFVFFKAFWCNSEMIRPDADYWETQILPGAIKYGGLLSRINSTPDFDERQRLFNEEFPPEDPTDETRHEN